MIFAFSAVLALSGVFARAAAPAGETPDSAMQSVVVKPGDTLWSIAHKYLRDPARWDEIVKNNKLPSSDPTVALPGMTLRVPIKLLKTDARTAKLSYVVKRVMIKRRDTGEWKPAQEGTELYRGDWVRTADGARARVTFMNKELMNLEPNSMAVVKPLEIDADVDLHSGSAFFGRSRVVTANAQVTPRTSDTRFAASIEPDLTTRVEVYKGLAGVEAQGSEVNVPGGMQTRVAPGLAPEVPRRIENLPLLEARAEEFDSATTVGGAAAPQPRKLASADSDVSTLRGDIDTLKIGTPILGYHVQASRDRDFSQVLFDRKYETDEHFSPSDARLEPGAYWWRVATIDLLGAEGPFALPHHYTVGGQKAQAASSELNLAGVLTVFSPEDGAVVNTSNVRVAGVLRDDRLALAINGKAARIDGEGNFAVSIPLHEGDNEIELTVTDGKGNSATRAVRRVRLR